ncbi:hypothetical protein D3C80_1386320 [compost metagenome]
MPSPRRSPTTRKPWKPARTGYTRSKHRTPSAAASAGPTAPPTTCKTSMPSWLTSTPVAVSWRASSANRCTAMPAVSRCPQATCAQPMPRSAPAAGCASPTKCRWVMAAWASTSGASRNRAWCRTSLPWPRAWVTASHWAWSSPVAKSPRRWRPRATSSPRPVAARSVAASAWQCWMSCRRKACGTTPVTPGATSRHACRRWSTSTRWPARHMARASTWGWNWCATAPPWSRPPKKP